MALREPRTVPASQGMRWAREGLELFAAAPAVWIGITILFLLMGVVLSIIPFAGMLWSVVMPIHAGGLMLGCRALREGRPLEVRHLFNGFEAPRFQPLALVGALYLAATLLVSLPLIALVVAASLLGATTVGVSGGSVASLVSVGVVGLIVVLVCMVAGVVLSLALWFAPALVVFDGLPPLDALKVSLRAGWANVGAFTVYALVLLGIGGVILSPLCAAVLLVVSRGEQASPMGIVLIGGTALFAGLCILLLMPTAWGAMYASYEDTFNAHS